MALPAVTAGTGTASDPEAQGASGLSGEPPRQERHPGEQSPTEEEPAGEGPVAEQPPSAREGPLSIDERAHQRAEEVLAAAAELAERIQQLDDERRAAEQRAHTEQGRRIELEAQHAAHLREAARWQGTLAELASAGARIHDLEQELTGVSRRANDAEELAGRARAERDVALRELERLRHSGWRSQLPTEMAVMRRAPPAGRAPAVTIDAIDGPAAQRARAQLSREQDALQTSDPAHWRRRTQELEQQLLDHARRAEQLYDVIDELRKVLDAIRGLSPNPVWKPPVLDDPDRPSSPVVEPLRLDAALERLRETIPPKPEETPELVGEESDTSGTPEPEEPEAAVEPGAGPVAPVEPGAEQETPAEPGAEQEAPAEPGVEQETPAEPGAGPEATIQSPPEPPPPTRKSWLLKVLRALAKEDPVAAGRLVLDLLPAQGATYKDSVSYDLMLSDAGCIRVTASGAVAEVIHSAQPRELSDVDFRVTGELASLSRLLAAGRMRRRVGRQMARVQGRRHALSGLVSLVRTPLGLGELHAAGVGLDPRTTFTIVSLMIDPKWTAGHRFTVAHRGPAEVIYLKVTGDGRPAVTTQPPMGPVAATIVSDPTALPVVLAGESPSGMTIRGTQEPIELLREWVMRAQRG